MAGLPLAQNPVAQRAKQDYIFGRHRNVSQLAAAYKVPLGTVWRWFRQDDWESARIEYMEKRGGVLSDLADGCIETGREVVAEIKKHLAEARRLNGLVPMKDIGQATLSLWRVFCMSRMAQGKSLSNGPQVTINLAEFFEQAAKADQARATGAGGTGGMRDVQSVVINVPAQDPMAAADAPMPQSSEPEDPEPADIMQMLIDGPPKNGNVNGANGTSPHEPQ